MIFLCILSDRKGTASWEGRQLLHSRFPALFELRCGPCKLLSPHIGERNWTLTWDRWMRPKGIIGASKLASISSDRGSGCRPSKKRRPAKQGMLYSHNSGAVFCVSGKVLCRYPRYLRFHIRRDLRHTNRTYSKPHVEIPLRKKVTRYRKVLFLHKYI